LIFLFLNRARSRNGEPELPIGTAALAFKLGVAATGWIPWPASTPASNSLIDRSDWTCLRGLRHEPGACKSRWLRAAMRSVPCLVCLFMKLDSPERHCQGHEASSMQSQPQGTQALQFYVVARCPGYGWRWSHERSSENITMVDICGMRLRTSFGLTTECLDAI
jgi:hypothetical protein